MLTAESLRERFTYDPDTGEFTKLPWVDAIGKIYQGGRVMGCQRPDGRFQIRIDGKLYYRSRLAWLYMTGVLPKYVDHINRDPSDDRICNLRPATHSQNCANKVNAWRKSSNAPRGVYRGRYSWVAQICKDGKNRSLGCFKTIEEAHKAYLAEAKIIHGEFLP